MAIDKLLFKEVGELPASATGKPLAKPPSNSAKFDSHVSLDSEFSHPVNVACLMSRAGMSLSHALEFINDLSNHRVAKAVITTDDVSALKGAIEQLGLKCSMTSLYKCAEL